jgi:hypothetical protein
MCNIGGGGLLPEDAGGRMYARPMSAQPDDIAADHDVIHLGGETAVVVPLEEYRLLKALRKRATPEEIEDAEFDAAIEEHEAWEAAGRPGVKSHEEFMAELLGPNW